MYWLILVQRLIAALPEWDPEGEPAEYGPRSGQDRDPDRWRSTGLVLSAGTARRRVGRACRLRRPQAPTSSGRSAPSWTLESSGDLIIMKLSMACRSDHGEGDLMGALHLNIRTLTDDM
ncbi:hypothetical protein STEG23_009589, partial [Scotinomys teguina]